MTFLFIWLLIQINFISIRSITYQCSSNSTCGCSANSAVLTKIIGGEIASSRTWGWAVSIRLGNNHMCGGSLISSNLVLTAAHCFMNLKSVENLRVTAGSTDLSDINQQKRSIAQIYVHRKYNTLTYVNDIAVLRLSSSFDMNDTSLALICLSTNIKINTDVIAIGWGIIDVNHKIPSKSLRQVTLKTIPYKDSSCQNTIRDEKVQFCAGNSNGGKDTCQGDSGGPLMMFSNEKWYLIGITSYGKSCAEPIYAGVYTRVFAYKDSIEHFLTNDTSSINRVFVIHNSASSISTCFFMNSFFIFLIFFFK